MSATGDHRAAGQSRRRLSRPAGRDRRRGGTRAAVRLVHPRPGGARVRGRVRRLAGHDRRGRLRQWHRCAGAGLARAGHRTGHERGDGVAHRGRHGGRDRDGRRDAGADRHRARLLHDGPRRTGRGAGASTGRRAADPRGHPGASLWPAGGAGADRRGLPPSWRRGDRGLRPGTRRHHRGPQGRHVRRDRHVQLLSDQEPRRAGRRRHAGDAGREAWRRHRRAAPVRLAHALHQRCGRREQPAGRTAGGDPAREAAPSRCAERAAAGDRCRLRCGAARRHRWRPRRGVPASATCSTFMCCARRSVLRYRRDCARLGSEPAFTTRARCICSRRIVDAWRSGRRAAGRRKSRPGRCSACRCIRN